MAHFFIILSTLLLLTDLSVAAEFKVRSIVKSNKVNIYEADIEDRELKKGVVVESLIGANDEFSGVVYSEISQCRNGSVYQLVKRKVKVGGAPLIGDTVVKEDICQQGLAALSYELKLEDACSAGEAIEFLIVEKKNAKKAVSVGLVFPKIAISSWESFLFIDEKFKHDPINERQSYIGVADVFLSLATAFPKVFLGQSVTLDYSINKGGVVSKYHDEFILNDASHSLDISQHQHNLDVGDVVTYRYKVAGFEYVNSFPIVKRYLQNVSLQSGVFTYSVELDDVDWYMTDPVSSVFQGIDYRRGGRHIDISHLNSNPLSGAIYGSYVLHMTLNGYTHLYLSTLVVR